VETTNSTDNPRVSVVIPAFNEEGNLEELMRQFDEMNRSTGLTSEAIVVDDGSTDETPKILKRLKSQYNFLVVCRHNNNKGLTDALQTGFAAARGEIFVFYPADLQYKPEDIPRMVEKIDEGFDVVTGWKQGHYAKRFVSSIYNTLSRRLFGLKVHDLNSVKAFRREVIEDMFLRKDWHRYLIALAAEAGYRIGEVKIPLYPRHAGDSKFSGFWRIPVGLLDLLAVKSQLTLLRKPLLFFGIPGITLLFFGFLAGLVAIYLRFFEANGFRPLLYLVILLMVMGLAFFMLGFLAEAMTSIKEELAAMRQSLRRLEDENKKRRRSEDGSRS